MTFLMKQFEFEWMEYRLEQWQENIGYGKWQPLQQPIPDLAWPQSYPPQPYTSPGNPGHIWIGDDPNQFKVTGLTSIDGSGTSYNQSDDLFRLNGDDLLKRS